MKSLIYRFIYNRHINFILRNINKFLQQLFKFKLPPAGKLNIKLKNGRTIQLYTNQTDYVAFCVFWKGIYNYEYTEIFEDLIRKCDGFIDIGSNAGLYSIIGAVSNDKLKILAFDPTDSAAFYFNKNINENDISRQIIYNQCAVSDANGSITFFKVKNPKYPFLQYNLGGSSGFVEKPDYFDELHVKKIRLDDFILQKHPDMRIDFVKIDAENAEPLILKGMQEIIRINRPIIVCEIMFDRVIKELENAFSNINYIFYFHKGRELIKVTSLFEKQKFLDVRNCFFVPFEKEHLVSAWTATGNR